MKLAKGNPYRAPISREARHWLSAAGVSIPPLARGILPPLWTLVPRPKGRAYTEAKWESYLVAIP